MLSGSTLKAFLRRKCFKTASLESESTALVVTLFDEQLLLFPVGNEKVFGKRESPARKGLLNSVVSAGAIGEEKMKEQLISLQTLATAPHSVVRLFVGAKG